MVATWVLEAHAVRRASSSLALSTREQFWILDFGFWIEKIHHAKFAIIMKTARRQKFRRALNLLLVYLLNENRNYRNISDTKRNKNRD